MMQRLLGAFLRFAHREGWLLKLAEYFDPPVTFEQEVNANGQHTAE